MNGRAAGHGRAHRARSRRIGALALALLTATAGGAGCARLAGARPIPARLRPGDSFHELRVDGRARTFLLHVPPGYDGRAPLPLLLVFHGSKSNAREIMERSGMSDEADARRFIVAYPNGTGWMNPFWLSWNTGGHCCGNADDQGADDVAFTRAIIDALARTGAVDRSRVYAAGFSDGARMVYRLACELSGELAGVASVAGEMPDTTCGPTRPISVVEIHGTADPRMRYGLARGWRRRRDAHLVSIPALAAFWARRDECTSLVAPPASGTVSVEAYTGCAHDTEVRLYTVHGLGHRWPGLLGRLPLRLHDRSERTATAIVWDFLSRFRLAEPGGARAVPAAP